MRVPIYFERDTSYLLYELVLAYNMKKNLFTSDYDVVPFHYHY